MQQNRRPPHSSGRYVIFGWPHLSQTIEEHTKLWPQWKCFQAPWDISKSLPVLQTTIMKSDYSQSLCIFKSNFLGWSDVKKEQNLTNTFKFSIPNKVGVTLALIVTKYVHTLCVWMALISTFVYNCKYKEIFFIVSIIKQENVRDPLLTTCQCLLVINHYPLNAHGY